MYIMNKYCFCSRVLLHYIIGKMMAVVAGEAGGKVRFIAKQVRMLCFPPHTCTMYRVVRAAVIKLGKNAWVIRGFHEMYLSQNMDVIKVNRLPLYSWVCCVYSHLTAQRLLLMLPHATKTKQSGQGMRIDFHLILYYTSYNTTILPKATLSSFPTKSST